jgi:hypothetical protein
MPIQGTSGSLANFGKFTSISPGAGNYWTFTSNASFLRLGSPVFDSRENIYISGYANIIAPFGGALSLAVNQSYNDLPNVSWQKAQNTTTALNENGSIDNIFYNQVTKKIYEVSLVGSTEVSNAVTFISAENGTPISTYTDYSNIGGNTGTASVPARRRPNAIIADNNGNYWICGKINERANTTTNNWRNYLNKYASNNQKVNNFVFNSAGGVTTAFFTAATNQMLFDNSNNIIMSIPYPANTVIQSYHGVVGFNTTTNSIDWQIKIPYPINAVSPSASDLLRIAKDSTGNLYTFSRFATNTGVQLYLLKFNSDCSIQYWTKTFSFLFSQSPENIDITTDSNNNPMLSIRTANATWRNNYIVSVNSASGNKIFERNLTSNNLSGLGSIRIINSNMYITYSLFASDTPGSIIKLPADGTILGTGNYTVSNWYARYLNSSNITITNGSPGVTTTGIFTQANGTNTVYSTSTFASNTAISTYNVYQI